MLGSARLSVCYLATTFVWAHHERWYANLVVFIAGDKVIFETRAKLGPDPTRDHAGKWAGKIADDLVKKHKVRDLYVDSGDGDTEEEP